MDFGGQGGAAAEEEEGSIKPQLQRYLFSEAAQLWRKEQGLDGTEIKY